MRLQVTIIRHGLPPINILWTSSSPFPHHLTTESSATIAQLVEDINDIIPLESGEWGLEDYIVEVGEYECLHFQPVESVLKEDDKVTIRALQSSDLRSRRYGGRHQVTSDGKHLIDGVPYGRPFVRKSDRPEVSIPSRKRKRSDFEEPTGYGLSQTTLLVASAQRLGPHLITSRPQLDSDSYHQNESEEEHEDEDEDFVDDGSSSSSGEDDDIVEEMTLSEDEENDLRSLSENVLGEIARPHKRRKLSTSSQSAPESKFKPLLLDYGQASRSSDETIPVSTSSKTTKSSFFENKTVSDSETLNQTSTAKGSNSKISSEEFSGSESTSSTDDRGDDSSEESISDDSSDTSRVGSSSSSSSVTSSSANDTDSRLEVSTSSSISSQESDRPSESEQSASDASSKRALLHEPNKTSTTTNFSPPKQSLQPCVPPGQGMKRTKQNNLRQKKRKRLIRLKETGELDPQATFQDLDNLQSLNRSIQHKQSMFEDEELKTKRDSLIRMLDDPGLTRDNQNPTEKHFAEAEGNTHTQSLRNQDQHPMQTSDNTSESGTKLEPTQKRSKLDIASSRRLLFGSLGLRVPKTQSAERELRDKLADEARKRPGGTLGQRDKSNNENAAPNARNEHEWTNKLNIMAVECIHEGIKLIPPPFPFVQRWDTKAIDTIQMRKGEPRFVDKKQRNMRKFYEDEFDSRQPSIEGNNATMTEDSVGFIEVARNQLMRDTNNISPPTPDVDSFSDDLPTLPDDLATLADLYLDDARPGSIIAYQTLEVGEDFQPRLSKYRTARVDRILENGIWEVTPSKRDLKVSVPNLTGLTDLDEEVEGSMVLDSLRRLHFADLVSPKLLAHAPRPEIQHNGDQHLDPIKRSDISQDLSTTERNALAATPVPEANANNLATNPEFLPSSLFTPRRQQISDIIKDAGFDSGLHPELQLSEALNARPESTATGPTNSKNGSLTTDEPPLSSAETKVTVARNNAGSQEDAHDMAAQSVPSPRFVGFDSSPRPLEQPNFDRAYSPNHIKSTAHSSATPIIQYPSLSRESLPNNSRQSQTSAADQSNGEDQMLRSPGESPHNSAQSTIQRGGLPEDDETSSLKSTIPPTENVEPPAAVSQISYSFPGTYSSYDGAYSSDDDLPSLNDNMSSARDQSPKLSPLPLKVSRRSERWSPEPANIHSPEATSSSKPRPMSKDKRSSEVGGSTQVSNGSQMVDLTISSSPAYPGGNDGDFLASSGPQRKSGWRPQTRPIRKAKGSSKSTERRKGKTLMA